MRNICYINQIITVYREPSTIGIRISIINQYRNKARHHLITSLNNDNPGRANKHGSLRKNPSISIQTILNLVTPSPKPQ